MKHAIRTLLALVAFALAAPAAVAASSKHYKLLRLDGRIVKWGAEALGKPAHVTYAFASEEVRDGMARNCKAMDALDGLARTSGLTVSAIERQAEMAFAQWQTWAGITFSRAASPEKADILIGAQLKPRGIAFANVRYQGKDDGLRQAQRAGQRGLNLRSRGMDARPRGKAGSVAAIVRSAVCLNPEHGWKIGFGGQEGAYDLLYTFTHEIGHAIGLDHARKSGQIMHFKYTEAFVKPQSGDVLGARALYGLPDAAPVFGP